MANWSTININGYGDASCDRCNDTGWIVPTEEDHMQSLRNGTGRVLMRSCEVCPAGAAQAAARLGDEPTYRMWAKRWAAEDQASLRKAAR